MTLIDLAYHVNSANYDAKSEFDPFDDAHSPEPPDPEEEFWDNCGNAPDPFETDRPQISSY